MFIIDVIKDNDSVFLKPLGVIIWFVSRFFQIVAGFLTTFTGFALYHAFSFFSNDIVKDFIFKLWYGFANFTFAFYVIVMAIGSAQIVLGIDMDHASIKKFLPRVIVSIFITSFSFVFFLVMLDIGNILTSVTYGIASGGRVGMESIAETLSGEMVPGGIENISSGVKALPSNAMVLLSGAIVVLFTGLLLLSFLSIAFVLISRTAILFISAILGPFAGLAYSIPGAEGLTGKWAKTLAHHAVLPAILAFFIGLAIQGADLISTFFQTTKLDQELFSVANFEGGGIKLSNLMTVAWIGTCLYFGSTKAISTEYTEQAIGLAKNIGHHVQGFFQPALEKAGKIALFGSAVTGGMGQTAQNVMAFGGAYKGAGWAYNKTEAKILEVGKTALELTGTRAKLAAKKSIFGLNRPVSPTNDTRNWTQRRMSGLRDSWHANISGAAADIHA